MRLALTAGDIIEDDPYVVGLLQQLNDWGSQPERDWDLPDLIKDINFCVDTFPLNLPAFHRGH